MSSKKIFSKVHFLFFPLLFVGCTLFEEDTFVISKVISNKKGTNIYYDVYQTGIDNYRFDFKAVNNLDTTKLFEYWLNDATYSAMKFESFASDDTITIKTNLPTNRPYGRTKLGRVVQLTEQ
jgi:hypothetical protein